MFNKNSLSDYKFNVQNGSGPVSKPKQNKSVLILEPQRS
jgi:hypothetical protein